MMICGFDSNKVSKSLKFCRRENRFIPFGSHVHGHLIWVKMNKGNKQYLFDTPRTLMANKENDVRIQATKYAKAGFLMNQLI